MQSKEKEFTYSPEDFGKLPVKVEHFNLLFEIFEDHTIVSNDLTMTIVSDGLQKLTLNAKNLEIKEVALYEKVKPKGEYEKVFPKKSVEYIYDKEKNKLHVLFPIPLNSGSKATLFTKTITRPTKNILEGLYYDETPPFAPPTQITQCQQWGFQRIVPCFDDMTAKCTYTTTIIADSKYTNMISNGDIAPAYKDKGGNAKSISLGNGRSKIVYYNHTTPMAPYLFFLGVGTYKTFKKEFEYPNSKKFMIELLAPLSADKTSADNALEILSHGIMWIHLHTGSGKYEALETKKEIWKLFKKRDALKESDNSTKEIEKIRKELKNIAAPLQLGYMYTGDVYREIGMQNSNFGGMENVGNTTIVTNRLLPFPQMTDDSFEYMVDIKCHEFYHNLNGSEVTGIDPFQLWLNEAVTVHIETEYNASIMRDAYSRISRVMALHAPMLGTFAEDSSPAAMPIVPPGFNTPDELITGMTYVKAPEFVKMIETLIGKEIFVKALALYHQRFKHKNASTADWLAAMEEVSGKELSTMASGWLYRTGFPRIFVKTSYEKGDCIINLEQKGFNYQGPWQFPFVFSLFDKRGKELIPLQIHLVKKEKEKIIIPVKEEPAYYSFNRNHALYGKVFYEQQTTEQLLLQAQTDTDLVNRYMAASTLLDMEKVKLIHEITAPVSKELLSLYGKILFDKNLPREVKALFLSITESVRDEAVMHKYKEIYAAKEKIRKAVAQVYEKELLDLYSLLAEEKFTGTYIEQQLSGMSNRDLKLLCLGLLASLDTKKELDIVKKELLSANASDKNTAMALYINSSASDKKEILLDFKKEAEQHLVSWENFLRIVGSNNSADAIEFMKEIEKDSHFRIEQSNDQRGLYLSFAANRKKSVLTEEGLAYLTGIIIKVSQINEYTGFHFLAAFSDLEKVEKNDQVRMVSALETIKKNITKKEQPSVYNNIVRILKNCPNAVNVWKLQ